MWKNICADRRLRKKKTKELGFEDGHILFYDAVCFRVNLHCRHMYQISSRLCIHYSSNSLCEKRVQRLTILILIKHSKHLLQIARRYQIDVPFVVAKQRSTYQCEFCQG
jgi:hypothetical protein